MSFLKCSERRFSFGSHTQLAQMGNYVYMGVLLHPCMANGILMLYKLFIWRKEGKKTPAFQRSVSLSTIKRSFSSLGKILFSTDRLHLGIFILCNQDEKDQAGILV